MCRNWLKKGFHCFSIPTLNYPKSEEIILNNTSSAVYGASIVFQALRYGVIYKSKTVLEELM